MATSGTTTYSVNRNELIKESMQLIRAIDEGVEPNSTQLTDASRTLNIMLKAWQAHGLNLWTMEEGTLTLVQGTGQYSLADGGLSGITEKALKITQVLLRDSDDNDVPLTAITRDEYYRLPSKTTEGRPTQYYYDVQPSSTVLNIWPTPDSTNAAYTLIVVYQSPIEDMTGATNDFDCPAEWYEAIKYGLGQRLAPVYGLPYNERLMLNREAKDILDLAMSWDTEQGSVYFTVENR